MLCYRLSILYHQTAKQGPTESRCLAALHASHAEHRPTRVPPSLHRCHEAVVLDLTDSAAERDECDVWLRARAFVLAMPHPRRVSCGAQLRAHEPPLGSSSARCRLAAGAGIRGVGPDATTPAHPSGLQAHQPSHHCESAAEYGSTRVSRALRLPRSRRSALRVDQLGALSRAQMLWAAAGEGACWGALPLAARPFL